MDNIFLEDKQYILSTYNRFNLAVESGSGATLTDYSGKEYIDFASGIAVNSFGVNDFEWKNAVINQLSRVQHTSNLFYSKPQVELAKILCGRSGAEKVFFSNSGAEANECAIKAARIFASSKNKGENAEILTLKNSFHGRTMATLSATGQADLQKGFSPMLPSFKYIEPNNYQSLVESVNDNTAAIIIELVQGESGVNELSKDYVYQVEKICKQNDILFIIDEVQTGIGRVGELFAFQHYKIVPDIVTLAKGLGGGLPIGATLFFKGRENLLTLGQHGSTFGGNPVVCAGAISIINRIDKIMLLEIQGKAAYMRTHLKRMDNVSKVSGIGLMIGFKTPLSAREIAEKCLLGGLIVLTAKDKVRLLPPLNITKTEIERGLKILSEVINR